VATTLSRDQEEQAFFSFPIEKREDTAHINPVDGTPDILIWGKATDGTIDGDREIVDPEWSAKAIQEWADTGANVRMSHDPRRPVGKGQQVEITTDGHFVKSLIADPLAKHFIRTGVLNDYSVGIMNPDFRHRDPKLDPHGKALRIITGRPDGSSRIGEISICDRGSNFNSSFRIVKSADGFAGQMVGDEDEIIKAAPASLTKAALGTDGDFVNVDLPAGASISISPADFARLRTFKQQLVTKTAGATAEVSTEKRDVSTAERRSLASEGNALPDGSYPINSTGDLHNAAHLARTGHGDAAAARRLIARRARELGVANPLDEGDSANKSDTNGGGGNATEATISVASFADSGGTGSVTQKAEAPADTDAAVPDVTKDPGDAPQAKKAKKPKKAKKMPPWLNKPGADGKGDDDGDADDSCKTAHAWTLTGSGDVPDIVCEKCHTTPAEAAGLSGTHDMTCAPVPELLESPPMASTKSGPTPQAASGAAEAAPMDPAPTGELLETPPPASAKSDAETPTALEAGMMKASPEVAAILRFKAAGIDIELGRLHDLTCPAYHPEDTQKHHPFADLRLTDESYFQRKAVEAACGPSLDLAKSLQLAWQAARVLREADPGQVNDFRMAAHKAFRDANPGPTSAPSPGMMTPGKYNRPLITDGHEASSPAHDGPNSSPQVATSAPSAHSFDRPPLASGHQSPSPSHMKADFEYPSEIGRPVQLNYAVMEKERARQALSAMHEHLSRQFPEACPMRQEATQPESRPVPPTAGIGKSVTPEPAPAAPPAPVAASFKAEPEEADLFADAEVYKGFKKMRKKLGKKVLSGSMTVDEARAKLGRQFAQKGDGEPQEAVQKSAAPTLSPSQSERVLAPAGLPLQVNAAMDPEVIKSAVAEATSELKDLLVKQQQDMAAQQETFTTKLAEQQRVIDAIADQPDPSTASFSGLAFNPLRTNKAARPAGVATQAEIAERTQHMVMRTLQDKYNSSSDPTEREAYYSTLARMRGYSEP
jgi:hypothetical protein